MRALMGYLPWCCPRLKKKVLWNAHLALCLWKNDNVLLSRRWKEELIFCCENWVEVQVTWKGWCLIVRQILQEAWLWTLVRRKLVMSQNSKERVSGTRYVSKFALWQTYSRARHFFQCVYVERCLHPDFLRFLKRANVLVQTKKSCALVGGRHQWPCLAQGVTLNKPALSGVEPCAPDAHIKRIGFISLIDVCFITPTENVCKERSATYARQG